MKEELTPLQTKLKSQFARRYKVRPPKSFPEAKESVQVQQETTPVHRSQPAAFQKHSLPTFTSSSLSKREELAQTLKEINFSHHHELSHIANNCNCGRHLCKISVIKPDLKKSSVYQRTYRPKPRVESVIVKAEETQVLKADHLPMSTEYLKQYSKQQNSSFDKVREKPKDVLRFQGVSQSISTYRNLYPGHKGSNQYVKPTHSHTRGEFPLKGKTIYSTEYITRKPSGKEYGKEPDHLKIGGEDWLGSTTYKRTFKNHNPEEVLPSRNFKVSEKHWKTRNFTHQFETNYQKEYLEKESPICPSKIMIERHRHPKLAQSKDLVLQNADFRALSPEFHAFATSKNFYV